MDKQQLQQEVLDFLNAHAVAVLASSSQANVPHAAAIYYVVEPDFTFYFLTKSNTQKFSNIAANNKVALVIVDHATPKSVEVEGIVDLSIEEVKRGEAINQIAQKSARMGKAYWPPPIAQLRGGEFIIIRVTPFALSFCDYTKGQSGEANIIQVIP